MKFNSFFFILLFSVFPLFCTEDFFRSNSNGLLLLKIDAADKEKYEYIVRQKFDENGLETQRTLFRKNVVEKEWIYVYREGKIQSERYYRNGEMCEEYFYDINGHKTQQTEFRNGKESKRIRYTYNKDGLVEQEEVQDLYLERTNKITYRYDSTYRIKQIIREMDDGTIVYWDAFFSKKGIVAKEYYTFGDESYIFYYGVNGEELKGEVTERIEVAEEKKEDQTTDSAVVKKTGELEKKKTKEQLKLKWENRYSRNGIKIYKEETNYKQNRTLKIWYNNAGREIRVQTFSGDELVKIEEHAYNSEDQLTGLKQIEGLSEKEWRYVYLDVTARDPVCTEFYENRRLKDVETINPDGTKERLLYGLNGVNLLQTFDKAGNKIAETTVFE